MPAASPETKLTEESGRTVVTVVAGGVAPSMTARMSTPLKPRWLRNPLSNTTGAEGQRWPDSISGSGMLSWRPEKPSRAMSSSTPNTRASSAASISVRARVWARSIRSKRRSLIWVRGISGFDEISNKGNTTRRGRRTPSASAMRLRVGRTLTCRVVLTSTGRVSVGHRAVLYPTEGTRLLRRISVYL